MQTSSDQAVPSVMEWRYLYQAADAFARLRPWTWMSDADVFGVQDPQTGQVGWCCVLGKRGEVFALVVYQGDQGFHTYLKTAKGLIDQADPGMAHHPTCLMASFENREILDPVDRQTITQTGLNFRGRNAWPQFRSFLPGHVPWYPDRIQARFMTLALGQAVLMADRFARERKNVAPARGFGRILVRVPERSTDPYRWQDRWRPIPDEPQVVFPVLPIDELRLQRIKRLCQRNTQTWELDTFYFPAPVGDRQRPYFPMVIVILDRGSGMALHTHLAQPPDHAAQFQDSLLKFLEKHKYLPLRLLVCKDENEALVRPMAARLNVTVEKTDRLGCVDDYRLSMFDHFFRKPPTRKG